MGNKPSVWVVEYKRVFEKDFSPSDTHGVNKFTAEKLLIPLMPKGKKDFPMEYRVKQYARID